MHLCSKRKTKIGRLKFEPTVVVTQGHGAWYPNRVRDNGYGIPEAITDKSFSHFLPPSPPDREPGWG